MRITRNLLHKFARETIKQRKRSEPDLHAAYLTGSLLMDDPLLGGTTDIDLVLVHKYKTPVDREIVPLTYEVSLDIYHKLQEDYEPHRQLRQDPVLGYPLTYNNILLFDTDHWLEFIQSSVTAEFHRTDNVLARVNHYLGTARANWFSMVQSPPEDHLDWLNRYLETLSHAANALSALTGPPLTTRRFITTLRERMDVLGVPKMLAGFLGLLGFSESHNDELLGWADALSEDFSWLNENGTPPIQLVPCRQTYYMDAIISFISGDDSFQALWPLLHTWLDIQQASPESTPGAKIWVQCLQSLALDEENTEQKLDALDAYLDTLEMMVENWAGDYEI